MRSTDFSGGVEGINIRGGGMSRDLMSDHCDRLICDSGDSRVT